MFSLFLLIVIAALVLGILGVVVHGLLWLLAIAIAIFVIDVFVLGAGLRGRRRRPLR